MKKFFINQFPLSNVENKYLTFKEEKFMEGVASHTWGENLDFEGKNSIRPIITKFMELQLIIF